MAADDFVPNPIPPPGSAIERVRSDDLGASSRAIPEGIIYPIFYDEIIAKCTGRPYPDPYPYASNPQWWEPKDPRYSINGPLTTHHYTAMIGVLRVDPYSSEYAGPRVQTWDEYRDSWNSDYRKWLVNDRLGPEPQTEPWPELVDNWYIWEEAVGYGHHRNTIRQAFVKSQYFLQPEIWLSMKDHGWLRRPIDNLYFMIYYDQPLLKHIR